MHFKNILLERGQWGMVAKNQHVESFFSSVVSMSSLLSTCFLNTQDIVL